MKPPVRNPSATRAWLLGLMTLFLLHGLFFSSWVSRSPEVQDFLDLSTFHMGVFVTAMSVGSVCGTYVGVYLVGQIRSRTLVRVSYLSMSASFAILGISVTAGDLLVSSAMVFLIGFTASIGGLTNNLEGARLDHESRRSILPSLHGMFSLGMLVGSGLGAILIAVKLPLALQFLGMAILVSVVAVIASFGIPRNSGRINRSDLSTSEIRQLPTKQERRHVWREPRTVTIAFIGMAFVIAESAAATWLPIALVNTGLGPADAALAFMFFSIAMTVGRFGGGFVLDAIGRVRTTTVIALIAAVGIALVMLNGLIHLPYLGALLWGLGCSLGFPIAVSALSDQPRMATPRVNSLVITTQVSNLASAPLLGGLGQVFGLLGAFIVPLACICGAAFFARATTPLSHRGAPSDATNTEAIDVVAVIAQREADDL